MLRYLRAAPILALALGGCARDVTPPAEESSPQPAVRQQVAAPNDDRNPSLKLVREGETFVLGDDLESVYKIFGHPKTSFEIKELPPGFQPPYTADGWEAATESVGAILYEKRVLTLMRQLPRSKQEDIQKMVADISAQNAPIKPEVVQGNRVVYYFWDKAPERIMISALSTKSNGWNITEVLGVTTILDALGISPTQARTDQPKVDLLLKSTKG